MKNSKKKDSGEKEDKKPVSSLQELQKKRAVFELEIAMGKSRDTAELASMRQEIARRLTILRGTEKPINRLT